MLEDAGYNNGLGMDDATKIQHFKHGIRESAGLEVALTQTRANVAYKRFDHLVSFLTAEVDHKSNRKKQLNSSKDRRVSSYKAGGRGNDNKNRQKGGKSNNSLSKVVDGRTLYAKQYSKSEFSSMTSKQRGAVISLNREKRKKANESKDDDDNSQVTRQLASLRTDMEAMGNAIIAGVSRATGEEMSVITNDNTQQQDDEQTNDSSKRKAASGVIGDFIRQTRRKRG